MRHFINGVHAMFFAWMLVLGPRGVSGLERPTHSAIPLWVAAIALAVCSLWLVDVRVAGNSTLHNIAPYRLGDRRAQNWHAISPRSSSAAITATVDST